jgi:hypothetical protein
MQFSCRWRGSIEACLRLWFRPANERPAIPVDGKMRDWGDSAAQDAMVELLVK